MTRVHNMVYTGRVAGEKVVKEFSLRSALGRFSLCVLLVCARPVFPQSQAPAEKQSVVTISNARKTEYKKDAATGGDAIILTGNVEISVENEGSSTKVKADEVRYNRENRMLYALGNITLEQKKKDGATETMTADVLLLNTETLEGFFDNARIVSLGGTNPASSGSSDAAAGASDSSQTLIVSADIMGKDAQNTIAFKNGSLTFCDDENPHWKINATRIWVLPGSEFAFFNAVLYVGSVPVFYLPFFYYPKDELVFNPVIGFEARRGYFTQTTTYIIGRKPLKSDSGEDSALNFLKQTEYKQQRLEGLVLRNLDENLAVVPRDYLKIVADYYSNLGWFTGLDGKFAPGTAIPQLDFSFFAGFSRTLFPASSNQNIYTVYSPTGKVHQDESNFLGMRIPFRYKANLDMRITQPFSLSLAMPLYSDVYFEGDFFKREETMDWLGYLTSNEAFDFDREETASEISSFTWNLDSSYSVPVTLFNPYLSSLSLKFSSSLIFSNKDNQLASEIQLYSPMRKFYYPSSSTPVTAGISFSGTLFQFPFSAPAKKNAGGDDEELQSALNAVVPPEKIKPETAKPETGEEKPASGETEGADTLPSMQPSIAFENRPGGITYQLGYSVSTDFANQLLFVVPNVPSDFDWSKVMSSMITFKSQTSLTSTVGWRDNFIGVTNRINFTPVYQTHPTLRESTNPLDGYTQSYIDSIKNNDYTARKLDTALANAVTLRPLVYNDIFSESNIAWNTGFYLVRTEYIGTVNKPEWEYNKPKWDDTSITEHTLNATLAAKEGLFSQRLTLSSNLPPRVDYYTYSAVFGFPYVNLTVQNGVGQKSKTDTTWKFDPLKETLDIKLFSNKLTLSQSYSYDIEEKTHSVFQTSVSGFGLSASYTMQYTYGYDMTPQNTYQVRTAREFLPVSMSLQYNSPEKKFSFWKNRISITPNLSTNVVFDMIRPTQSYFTFIPKITFTINQFLDISFSSTSRNNVIYRYFQQYGNLNVVIPGETNIFKDLINSFAFGNKLLREESGFKLQSLTLEIKHDMHDWLLSSSLTLEPRLIRDKQPYYYDMSPYFTISVLWRPMQSIKTTIEDKYGTVTLNPPTSSN